VTLVGLVISFLSTTFSQAEDMGIFLTVSAFVSKGYKLYSETFEIKDPMFFYINAIGIESFGVIGPYLFDFLITAAIAPIGFLIARKLTKSATHAFVASFVLELSVTGVFGQTLRTQVLAILMLLMSMYCALQNNWLLSGLFSAAVLFSKMPMFVVIATVLFALILRDRKLIHAYQCFIGFTIFVFSFLLLMIYRGEFYPYLDMVKENFGYGAGYQTIVGQSEGIVGHVSVWNGAESRATTFVVANLGILYYAYKNRILKSQLFTATFSMNIGVAVFLIATAMWPHHLQITSLYIFMSVLFLLDQIDSRGPQVPKFNRNNHNQRKPNTAAVTVFLPIITIGLLISNSGGNFSLKPETPLGNWVNPQWATPSEIALLEVVAKSNASYHKFARLGSNDDSGFGAFLTTNWRMVCQRHAIAGAESIDTVAQFLSCLRSEPEVILISPAYSAQSQRQGSYQYYYKESQLILRELFDCQLDSTTPAFQYCLRR
jgi:hypothetical protein